MSNEEPSKPSVVVVGGGFAGVGCARELAKHDVAVTLLDRHNYHQFQPLLYQVATAELSTTDVARPLRGIFAKDPTVAVKQAEVTSVDPTTRTVTTLRRPDLHRRLPGARGRLAPELLRHRRAPSSTRSRSTRSIDAKAPADPRCSRCSRTPTPTRPASTRARSTSSSSARGRRASRPPAPSADLVNDVMPKRYHDLDVKRTRIYLVDHGPVVLAAFSDKAHAYAAGKLEHSGVTAAAGDRRERDRRPTGSCCSDGTEILTRTVVWAGGIQAPELAATTGLATGARRPADRPARPDRRGPPAGLRDRRHGQHARPRRRRPAPARLGGTAGRPVGRREHPRRHRRQARASPSSTTTRASWP